MSTTAEGRTIPRNSATKHVPVDPYDPTTTWATVTTVTSDEADPSGGSAGTDCTGKNLLVIQTHTIVNATSWKITVWTYSATTTIWTKLTSWSAQTEAASYGEIPIRGWDRCIAKITLIVTGAPSIKLEQRVC